LFSVLFYHTQYTEEIDVLGYVTFVVLFQHRKKIAKCSISNGTHLIMQLETLVQMIFVGPFILLNVRSVIIQNKLNETASASSPIFTELHVMQTRYSDYNSVCQSVRLSVRLSVTRVYYDKTGERSVQIFIPYKR